jgi:hypothetical protein
MTKEEISKLLGGYATNTLSESERQTLYDAALEDQELFNALQEEEALKELLADPVSRALVAQALARPASRGQHAGLRLRWWAWSGAVSAVAAAAIVFAVIRSNQVSYKAPAIQIASTERPASSVVAEPPAARAIEPKQQSADQKLRQFSSKASAQDDSRLKAKDEEATNAPPAAAAPVGTPAPAPPGIEQQQVKSGQSPESVSVAGAAAQLDGQVRSQAQAANSFRDRDTAQTPAAENIRLPAAMAGAAGRYSGPNLRYTLVKRDANGAELPVASDADLKAGDAVRLNVSTGVPGHLVLYQLDPRGDLTTVADVMATANSSQTIPPSAIQVQSSAQRFRLALEPVSISPQVLGGARAEKKAAAPLVIEFTIAGK